MKKRLRKKKHIGDFQELGFSLSFMMKPGISQAELEVFAEVFLTQTFETNSLCFVGTGDLLKWDGLVMTTEVGMVTEEQRQSMISWLEKNDIVGDIDASELLDVWYD